jgi:hypothetical protein
MSYLAYLSGATVKLAIIRRRRATHHCLAIFGNTKDSHGQRQGNRSRYHGARVGAAGPRPAEFGAAEARRGPRDDPLGRVFRSAGNRVMVVGFGEC